MRITVTNRRLRRIIRRIRQAARDGMRLSVLALVAVVVFAHPGHQELLVIAVGLAGIFCSRLSAAGTGSRPAAVRPPSRSATGRTPRPQNVVRQYSPECLANECGSCSGIGCDHGCPHPGRSRTRSRRNGSRPPQPVPDDSEPPF